MDRSKVIRSSSIVFVVNRDDVENDDLNDDLLAKDLPLVLDLSSDHDFSLIEAFLRTRRHFLEALCKRLGGSIASSRFVALNSSVILVVSRTVWCRGITRGRKAVVVSRVLILNKRVQRDPGRDREGRQGKGIYGGLRGEPDQI